MIEVWEESDCQVCVRTVCALSVNGHGLTVTGTRRARTFGGTVPREPAGGVLAAAAGSDVTAGEQMPAGHIQPTHSLPLWPTLVDSCTCTCSECPLLSDFHFIRPVEILQRAIREALTIAESLVSTNEVQLLELAAWMLAAANLIVRHCLGRIHHRCR